MKKTLAILLALMLVFSSIPVAFAEEALPVDAQAAKDLGMLVGSGNGVTNAYLAETPTRIQAAVMFLRLKGLEETAKAFTGTANFADADQAAWAKPIMAYLLANPDLGFNGVGGDKFDPNGLINAASYYKVMLTALGYKQNTTEVIGDFTFPNVIEFAASKGLTKVAAVTNYTVNDLATATIEALKATLKGSEKSLAASLVDAKVITVDAAVKAGVYTVAPTVLAVESVEAVNLKETVVTFNKEVDKKTAEDASNYLLDDEDIAGDVALNADKKSVTITWDANLDNQTEYDMTVSGVLDAAGSELEEVTVTFLANDVTLPVAQSISLVGPNKFKLTFSEPINDAEDLVADYSVTVEDKDFDYEVAAITVDGNEATVELSDSELEVGDYTVTVSGFQDYAELKGLKKVFTLAYAKDTTAPVATIKSASQTKVVVDFNKPVYAGDPAEKAPLTKDFFYHTYKNYAPAMVYTSDFEEYSVFFTTEAADAFVDGLATEDQAGVVVDADVYQPLPEGNVKFVVYSEDDNDNVVTDEWGNEMAADATLALTISSDVTAPTVTKVEVDDQKNILVYFSEDVDTDVDNYTVVDKDGEEVDIADFSYSNADDEYVATLTFEDNLEGDYTVTVADVVDLALESNEIAKVDKKFTVGDETAPTMTTAEGVAVIGVDKNGVVAEEPKATDVDYIYVTFPEDMATSGTYSVLNKDNYQLLVSGDLIDLKSADKIATFNGNDRVRITIDNSGLYDVSNGSVQLVIGRVADALGNVTKGNDVNATFVVEAEDSPVITAVETLTKKTIEITINGELKAVNKAYIKVNHDTGVPVSLYAISSWKLDKGDTVITAVLPSSEYLTTSADTDLTVTLTTDDLVTVSGTKVDYDVFSAVEDGIAPTVAKDGTKYDIDLVSGDTAFTVKFDEDLATSDVALFAHDLVVKDSKGDALVAGIDYETTLVSGDTIQVTINDVANQEPGDYKVYSNDTIKYIKDLAGNTANAFTTSFTLIDLVPEP